MQCTCATYNILHGYHSDLILQNIRFLMDQGADIILLQEAEVQFEEPLRTLLAEPERAAWNVRFAHRGRGGNVATLWRADRFALKNTHVVDLPKYRMSSSVQRLHGLAIRAQRNGIAKKIGTDVNRIALIAEFEADGKVLQVTNAHLAWEGGARHRMRQLKHMRSEMLEKSADFRIVAGDFNTIALRPLHRRAERRVEKTLGTEFRNAFPRLPWTHDISFTDPTDGLQFIATLSRAGVKFRRRLDYMFAQDMTVLEGTMHDLPGSDHRPLIATFALPERTAAVQ